MTNGGSLVIGLGVTLQKEDNNLTASEYVYLCLIRNLPAAPNRALNPQFQSNN